MSYFFSLKEQTNYRLISSFSDIQRPDIYRLEDFLSPNFVENLQHLQRFPQTSAEQISKLQKQVEETFEELERSIGTCKKNLLDSISNLYEDWKRNFKQFKEQLSKDHQEIRKIDIPSLIEQKGKSLKIEKEEEESKKLEKFILLYTASKDQVKEFGTNNSFESGMRFCRKMKADLKAFLSVGENDLVFSSVQDKCTLEGWLQSNIFSDYSSRVFPNFPEPQTSGVSFEYMGKPYFTVQTSQSKDSLYTSASIVQFNNPETFPFKQGKQGKSLFFSMDKRRFWKYSKELNLFLSWKTDGAKEIIFYKLTPILKRVFSLKCQSNIMNAEVIRGHKTILITFPNSVSIYSLFTRKIVQNIPFIHHAIYIKEPNQIAVLKSEILRIYKVDSQGKLGTIMLDFEIPYQFEWSHGKILFEKNIFVIQFPTFKLLKSGFVILEMVGNTVQRHSSHGVRNTELKNLLLLDEQRKILHLKASRILEYDWDTKKEKTHETDANNEVLGNTSEEKIFYEDEKLFWFKK